MANPRRKETPPLRIPIGQANLRKNLRPNRVKTTKYTWLTFIPLNFYEQFRRAVYFYFLIITIVSFFVSMFDFRMIYGADYLKKRYYSFNCR